MDSTRGARREGRTQGCCGLHGGLEGSGAQQGSGELCRGPQGSGRVWRGLGLCRALDRSERWDLPLLS